MATRTSWFTVGYDAWMLSAEASMVAGLRLAKIAHGGPAAVSETQLMVSEKIAAFAELQAAAVGGQLGSAPLTGASATVRHYRRKVAANRRRLTKHPR